MNEASKTRLGEALLGWVVTQPHDEVVRRYRALSWDDKMAVTGYGWEESASALNSSEPPLARLELLARCFDVFADGEDVDPLLSSKKLFRRRANALRHPEGWRKEQEAEAKRHQLSERRLRALALASSCLADEPDDVRLRRIEEVLPQLNQLADQAVAEGDLDDESAIGEDIVGLWRLRDDLRRGL